MDDNRHAGSISRELTETDVPRLMLFEEGETILAARAYSSSGAAEVAGRDFGWSRMSGRRTSGSSRPSLGVQVLAVFSFIS